MAPLPLKPSDKLFRNNEMKFSISFTVIFATLFLYAASVAAEADPSIKYPINTPPSAQLYYAVKADRSGFSLNGEADMHWQVAGSPPTQTYSVTTETRAAILGKILEANSYGDLDAFGLAPNRYEEKPFKKAASQTTFDRAAKQIAFSDAKETAPLYDGAQDRTSAVWQLVSIARGSPKKFKPRSKWSFFVAGRRNAEKWTFTVERNVTLSTVFGNLPTVHITKSTSDSKDQRIEIWLAPSKDWYPIRIKSEDPDGDTIEQNLVRINKLGNAP
jgi:hypothetical protein